MKKMSMTTSKQEVYSHGLEKIYEYEVVNPATVRTFAAKRIVASDTQTKPSIKELPYLHVADLHFDFGPAFSQSMQSLRLDEPIESFSLSPFALKAIISRGIKTVGELCKALPQLQTLGLGHQDELQQKVTAQLGKNPFTPVKTVNFVALVRLLLNRCDAKDRYLLLERFDLVSLFPLKPNELHEIEKWDDSMRKKALIRVREGYPRSYFETKLKEITQAFIVPWLQSRFGFARNDELGERLFMISEHDDEKQFYSIIELLQWLLGSSSLYQLTLQPIAPDLYAQDTHARKQYEDIVKTVQSYFYSAHSRYPLYQLIQFLQRDFAMRWKDYPQSLIEKVIGYSPAFVLLQDSTRITFVAAIPAERKMPEPLNGVTVISPAGIAAFVETVVEV